MEYEKIIKDERGKIRIHVRFVSFDFDWKDKSGNLFRYDVTVWHSAKRKRIEIVNEKVATKEEIESTKIELWNLMNPIHQSKN